MVVVAGITPHYNRKGIDTKSALISASVDTVGGLPTPGSSCVLLVSLDQAVKRKVSCCLMFLPPCGPWKKLQQVGGSGGGVGTFSGSLSTDSMEQAFKSAGRIPCTFAAVSCISNHWHRPLEPQYQEAQYQEARCP